MSLMLKDDKEIVERYKEYHRKAWPEVVARLREVGIVNRRVYLLGRRMAGARANIDLVAPSWICGRPCA